MKPFKFLKCIDIGKEPELNKNPFWKKSKETTSKYLDEHKDQQAEKDNE